MESNRFAEILTALEFESLEKEDQESLLTELHELIYRGAMVRLLERMDEGTKEEFEKLLEGDASDEEVESFIAVRVPDSDQIVAETVAQLTDDIVTVTGSK